MTTQAATAFRREAIRLPGSFLPASLAQALCALHEQRQRLEAERAYLKRAAGEQHLGVASLSKDLRDIALAIADLEAFGLPERAVA